MCMRALANKECATGYALKARGRWVLKCHSRFKLRSECTACRMRAALSVYVGQLSPAFLELQHVFTRPPTSLKVVVCREEGRSGT